MRNAGIAATRTSLFDAKALDSGCKCSNYFKCTIEARICFHRWLKQYRKKNCNLLQNDGILSCIEFWHWPTMSMFHLLHSWLYLVLLHLPTTLNIFCFLHFVITFVCFTLGFPSHSLFSLTSHSSFSLPCIALHCLWYVPPQLCIKVCSCYNLQHFVVIVVWFPVPSLFVLYTSPLCQALCYQVFFTLPSVFMYVAISFLSCTAHHHLCT